MTTGTDTGAILGLKNCWIRWAFIQFPELFDEISFVKISRIATMPTASRRAEAVEAGGMICPLRIAEIGRAAGESISSHWNPSRMEQVRAGFHHDGGVSRPRDDETEPVGLHAKARAAVQNEGIWKEP